MRFSSSIRPVRSIAALVCGVAMAVNLAACTDGFSGEEEEERSVPFIDHLVGRESKVVADADGTGVDVSAQFYDSSETVVVATPERADQLKAAAIAVELGAPMLVRKPGAEAAVDGEIARLGAQRVINVAAEGGIETDEEDLTLIEETASVAAEEGGEVAQIVARGAENAIDDASPAFATEETSWPAVATATAKRVEVTVLPYADPRVTPESIELVKGSNALGLGQQFGTSEYFAGAVDLAGNGELPGGGGLVFPGRRMVALYGHPSGPALGQMGEQPPAESVEVAKQWVEQYQPFSDELVIPAFEVIATVASASAGDDGNFTNESAPEELIPYIDAITEAGGYAVIDLQPGLATFKEQAMLYEDLLKRPNVGLALDAEWKLLPGQTPAAQVGSASAEEINEATEWLAQLTRENDLPQKALIVHQFQVAMLPDRENINTAHPELSFILHADGHGTPEQKFDTWNVLRENLDPRFFVAWKNFIDEDMPMFTPEQTYNTVDPRPWFVSYQ